MSAHGVDSSRFTAKDWKERGNKLFSVNRFKEAIQCYDKAIEKSPSGVDVYYTNRSLAYLKLQCWDACIADCKLAEEINPRSVKAYYYRGIALSEQGHYDEALTLLTRAHELALEKKVNFGDDITSTIRSVKKRRFEAMEEKRIQQEVDLMTYLESLIKSDTARRLDMISKSDNDAAMAVDDAAGEQINDGDVHTSTDEELRTAVEQESSRRLGQLHDLFSQLDERRRKRDIPDFLCGKISFELMREPVIAPSGITYDRRDIEEHLQRVGHFDPITRAPLTTANLTPNLAMKEVIDAFLESNPWAEDF